MRAHASVSASARVIYVWDGNSLTLAGILYGIVVTVVGVVVATLGTFATVVYAIVALGVLAAGLWLFAQPIIGAMRRLLAHGQR